MNTATNTPTVEQIREAFQYWGNVPALCEYGNETALRAAYERQSGPTHWFDADTLRFFGSRNREMVARGIMIECQTNAPADCGRYNVTAWVLDPNAARDHRTPSGRIVPKGLAKFDTRAQARRFAVEAAAVWSEVQG